MSGLRASLVDAVALLFGASNDVVRVLARDGSVVYSNALGEAHAKALDAPEHAQAVDAVWRDGAAVSFEWGEHSPGGVRLCYSCTVSPIREGDAVTAALSISRDMTELRRENERLRRSEQMLVDTQGVAHLGTWDWDVTRPNATWSDELYRIYGLTPETYTPSYEAYLTKIHPEDRQRVIDATNRVFQEHIPYSHDERVFRPDGSIRYLHTWAFPVLDDAGKLARLVGVCQDITDRKLAEDEVRRLNAGLEQRVAERTQTIERSLRDLEAFQAMLSHDLRAPLSVISGSAALLDLERGHLPPSATKNVERIQRAVTQMTRLVNDLLTLAHVGNSPLEVTSVDLSALAEDVVAHLRRSHDAMSSTIVSIEPGLTCRADPSLLRTVMENLLGNAWKYSSRAAEPRIEVGATEHQGRPAFFVRDNGAGFDMKDVDRLFAPFERLHKASEFEGTGVGLAAVHRIVERHGGGITAVGAPNEGATFTFSLG